MLAPWRKSYDKTRHHTKTQRHYLLINVHLIEAMVFPVVMYGCENWPIKKAEHWRIDAFELWCWRIHMRVPGRARRSSQSFQKEMSPVYSLERLMLKLKLQYLGHLIEITDSLEMTDAGKEWRQEEKGTTEDDMIDITNSVGMNLSKLQELVMDRKAWHAAVHGVTKSWRQLSYWMEPIVHKGCNFSAFSPTLVIFCIFNSSYSNR